MPDPAPFLAAVCASPDDDLPRLVFADWLDEHGDPARAEFIRVQCELATLPDHDPRRRTLEDREHDLLSEHEAGWIGDGAEGLQEWDWRRGFVDDVRASHRHIEELGDHSLLNRHPVHTVSNFGPWSSDQPHFWQRLPRPWWATVRRLCAGGGENMTIDQLGWFLRHATHSTNDQMPKLCELDLTWLPDLSLLDGRFHEIGLLTRLRSLSFGRIHPFRQHTASYGVDPHGFATTFADCPLALLGAGVSGLTSDGLRTLLSAPFAATLKQLDISDNPIAPDAYRVFEQAHRSMRLKRLDVSGTPLAGISLEPLLHARSLESLTRLEMNGCGSARRNMEVLAGSPFWAQADHLRAHSGTIPASTFEPLAHSQGPPTLRLLDLADNYLRTSGVRLLCESPWVGSLTWLALSANYLDDESCRVLARSGRFTHLRTLHLAHNNTRLDRGEGEQITDAGATELANEPSLANLRLLSLSNTGVTHRGVNAVLNGLYWRLFGLGLAGNDLSPEVVRILAGSPRLARFVWLDLADNPRLRGRALLPLAESPYLSRLCELDCGGIDLADDVRTAFRERLGPRFSH